MWLYIFPIAIAFLPWVLGDKLRTSNKILFSIVVVLIAVIIHMAQPGTDNNDNEHLLSIPPPSSGNSTPSENGSANPSASNNVDYYTATFIANGGTFNTQTFTPRVVTALEGGTPIRVDYIFVGWTSSESGTSPIYYNGDSMTLTESVTFYAVWDSDEPQTTNSLEASNNEENPLEAPKDYTPVFASYQENNGKYEITVRLSFYADTVEVTYSKPQDEVNYHSGSLPLNKIGEKTWVGTLDKQEVNANLDSISISSEKDNLTIYYTLNLNGQKKSLPAEIDIVVFNPEVNVAETKRDSFVQLKYTTNIQMKRAEGFYYDKDNNQIKFGLNSDDGYSWTPTQTIDKNNVSWNIYVIFFDNKDIQYTKKH